VYASNHPTYTRDKRKLFISRVNLTHATITKATHHCSDDWQNLPLSYFPQPPTIHTLHRKCDDNIKEWAVDGGNVEPQQGGIIAEVVNKPEKDIVHDHEGLSRLNQK